MQPESCCSSINTYGFPGLSRRPFVPNLHKIKLSDCYTHKKAERCVFKQNPHPSHLALTKSSVNVEIKLTSGHRLSLSFVAPDFRAYLIGGILAFLLLVASVLCIYHSFKIDIVLWYRGAFHTAQAPDGKCVWWSLGAKSQNCCAPTPGTSLHVPLLLLPVGDPFSWLEDLVNSVSAGLHVLQRNLSVIVSLLCQ